MGPQTVSGVRAYETRRRNIPIANEVKRTKGAGTLTTMEATPSMTTPTARRAGMDRHRRIRVLEEGEKTLKERSKNNVAEIIEGRGDVASDDEEGRTKRGWRREARAQAAGGGGRGPVAAGSARANSQNRKGGSGGATASGKYRGIRNDEQGAGAAGRAKGERSIGVLFVKSHCKTARVGYWALCKDPKARYRYYLQRQYMDA